MIDPFDHLELLKKRSDQEYKLVALYRESFDYYFAMYGEAQVTQKARSNLFAAIERWERSLRAVTDFEAGITCGILSYFNINYTLHNGRFYIHE